MVAASLLAQKKCNLHIITARDNMPEFFPINCEINGQPYKFKAGQCMTIPLVGDYVTIIMTDKRWVRRDEVHLHEPAQDDMYVRLIYGYKQGENKNKIKLIAESICKSCFEELRSKCKSKLNDLETP